MKRPVEADEVDGQGGIQHTVSNKAPKCEVKDETASADVDLPPVLSDGQELEVLWRIEDEGQAVEVWWSATLCRTSRTNAEDKPVWELQYESMEGFDAETRQCVFVSPTHLIDLTESQTLPWVMRGDAAAKARIGDAGTGSDHSEPEDADAKDEGAASAVDDETCAMVVERLVSAHEVPRNAARRAVQATGGASLDDALAWIQEHIHDSDFNAPLVGDVDRHASESRFDVGMAVKARWKEGEEYYAGMITAVHKDGSCDIKYTDGCEEVRVQPALIDDVSDGPTEPAAADGSDPEVAGSIDGFVEEAAATIFSSLQPRLTAAQQVQLAEHIQQMKPKLRAELVALQERRGRGATINGADIKAILPRLMRGA